MALSYQEFGQGHPIIFLHGFPMNKKIWSSFAPQLATNFKVYTVDLPGFGESPFPQASISIDSIADEVLAWAVSLNINNCVVIGHSLGGYVALAMAEKAPEFFAGFALFHSTALADNEEKKQSRNKVLEFVDKNGAEAFTTGFIPPLFADKNHPAIEKVKQSSQRASAETVKGYTAAMRDRKDRTDLLRKFEKPILFIAGKEDGGIPFASVEQQASTSLQPELHVLESVGHMGMFEAEATTLSLIRSFALKVFGITD